MAVKRRSAVPRLWQLRRVANFARIFVLAGTALALLPRSAASSTLIDFETLPSGEPTTEGEIGGAYAQLGVEFSKFNADDPIGPSHTHDLLLQPGTVAADGARSTMTDFPGFNVFVEFTEPVSLVGAEVIAPIRGELVILTAFDSEGTEIGSIAAPAPALGGTQLMELSEIGPIYSALWYTEAPTTGPGIDNLRFEPLPEPSSTTMILISCSVLGILRLMPQRIYPRQQSQACSIAAVSAGFPP